MGWFTFVNPEECKTQYKTTIQCDIGYDNATRQFYVGNLKPRSFEPNPDIAGDGVLYAFFVVSALAVLSSIIYLCLQLVTGQCVGMYGVTRRMRDAERTHSKVSRGLEWFVILEGIILSCSDQQIFTSGAYAITLQSTQGCKISTYHYNIISSMLLMTCATHISSALVVSQHRKGKAIIVIRIFLVILLFAATGCILTNLTTKSKTLWPTEVPAPNQNQSLLLRPAACFGSNHTAIWDTLKETFETEEKFLEVIATSRPGTFIRGWSGYIIISIIYGSTVIVGIIHFLFHPHDTDAITKFAQRSCWKKLCYFAFYSWQVFGVSSCAYTISDNFLYILRLKEWMNGSEWIAHDPITGLNPEKDATTFGQLVPILLTLLTVFVIIQWIEERLKERYEKNKQIDIESHHGYTTPKNSKHF